MTNDGLVTDRCPILNCDCCTAHARWPSQGFRAASRKRSPGRAPDCLPHDDVCMYVYTYVPCHAPDITRSSDGASTRARHAFPVLDSSLRAGISSRSVCRTQRSADTLAAFQLRSPDPVRKHRGRSPQLLSSTGNHAKQSQLRMGHLDVAASTHVTVNEIHGVQALDISPLT